MKKLSMLAVSAFALLIALPTVVSAHVVVKPAQVAPGARQVFTTGVPNEHDTPVAGVRVLIPDGLKSVRPHVKPGWNVELVKSGEGESAVVTEIIWTGGQIPVELRDEFVFSAQAPATTTQLKWKAYETYADGTVVAWDQEPNENDENNKPYSITEITESEPTATINPEPSDDRRADIALGISAIALLLSIALPFMRKQKS